MTENNLSNDTDSTSNIDSPELSGSAQKRQMHPGFLRNIKIIGAALGLIVLAVTLIFVMGSSKKQPVASSQISLGSSSGTESDDGMTPAMRQKLKEQQIREAAAAADKGDSYIPPDTSPVKPAHEAPIGGVGQSTMEQTSTAPMRAAGIDQDVEQRRRDGLRRQLEALTASIPDGNEVRERVTFERAADKQVAAANTTTAAATASTAADASKKKQILKGLYITSGELANDLKINEGGTGFASARINSGPAAGAYLIGTAKATEEEIEITLNQMELNGKLYKVDAIVLDEVTANNAIAGNVDSRPLQRYVFPVFLAAAQGFYSAQGQTASTTTINVGGVTTDRSSATFEQARAAGTAKGLEIVQQEVQKSAQKPLKVSQKQKYAIGILFRAPVFDEGQ